MNFSLGLALFLLSFLCLLVWLVFLSVYTNINVTLLNGHFSDMEISLKVSSSLCAEDRLCYFCSCKVLPEFSVLIILEHAVILLRVLRHCSDMSVLGIPKNKIGQKI